MPRPRGVPRERFQTWLTTAAMATLTRLAAESRVSRTTVFERWLAAHAETNDAPG